MRRPIEFKSGNEKLLAEQRGRIPSEEVTSQVPAVMEEKIKASTLVHDGKLLFEMDKLDEAEAKLKLALKQDPHNEAALYYLNLVSEAKYIRAAKLHEVTMRQDIRAVEQAWANPVKPRAAARPESLRPHQSCPYRPGPPDHHHQAGSHPPRQREV